jgi:hypothetical protein
MLKSAWSLLSMGIQALYNLKRGISVTKDRARLFCRVNPGLQVALNFSESNAMMVFQPSSSVSIHKEILHAETKIKTQILNHL